MANCLLIFLKKHHLMNDFIGKHMRIDVFQKFRKIKLRMYGYVYIVNRRIELYFR